jgi:hypothetical protein
MYYWIQAGFELRGDVRRVADEQFELLRRHLFDPAPDPHEAVHEARRALRRLRALLALFQDEVGSEYDNLREPYRSCTRALSGLRDAHALVETLARARRREGGRLGVMLWGSLDERLRARRDRLLETATPDRASMRRVLDRAKRQLALWTARADLDVLRHGLKRRYRRGRKALRRAQDSRRMDAMHALRRRSRELGLDYALLQSLFPNLEQSGIRRAHRVAQLLGRERELLQLRGIVRRMRHAARRAPAIDRFTGNLAASAHEFHERALRLAAKVYEQGRGPIRASPRGLGGATTGAARLSAQAASRFLAMAT